VRAADHPCPETTERDEVRVLHLEGDLEVVAGSGLVEGRRGQLGVLAAGQVVTVRVVDPRPRAVGRRRVVVGERRVLLLVLLDRAYVAGRLGQNAEEAWSDR